MVSGSMETSAELIDEVGERPLERRKAPGEAVHRRPKRRVALDQVVGGELDAGAARDLERLGGRDPAQVIEVDDRRAVAAETPVELAAERVGRGGEHAAAGGEVAGGEAQQGDGV